jgi:hypothetical protein
MCLQHALLRNISLLLAARRECSYARGRAKPSHHAAADQDHPRAGRPSARATRKISTRVGGGGASRQSAQHGAITNRRTTQLRTPMEEEFVYYVPSAEGCVPWDGVGSGRRDSHIWHQSKARTLQGLGGRRAVTASRRRDVEGGRRGGHARARWRCRPASARTPEEVRQSTVTPLR